jgi:hypothetical protein
LIKPLNKSNQMTSSLAELGYAYVAGPTGDRSDWVLRQTGNTDAGFEWRGQENYDAVGSAVLGTIKELLVEVCGLKQQKVVGGGTCFVSPGIAESSAPLLLLVCGSEPGGAVGVWGRSLCINATLLEGAMFDYIARAEVSQLLM